MTTVKGSFDPQSDHDPQVENHCYDIIMSIEEADIYYIHI